MILSFFFLIRAHSERYFADWRTAQYRSERALHHKIPGNVSKIRALSRSFPPNARISGRARIYPGDLLTLLMKTQAGSESTLRLELQEHWTTTQLQGLYLLSINRPC